MAGGNPTLNNLTLAVGSFKPILSIPKYGGASERFFNDNLQTYHYKIDLDSKSLDLINSGFVDSAADEDVKKTLEKFEILPYLIYVPQAYRLAPTVSEFHAKRKKYVTFHAEQLLYYLFISSLLMVLGKIILETYLTKTPSDSNVMSLNIYSFCPFYNSDVGRSFLTILVWFAFSFTASAIAAITMIAKSIGTVEQKVCLNFSRADYYLKLMSIITPAFLYAQLWVISQYLVSSAGKNAFQNTQFSGIMVVIICIGIFAALKPSRTLEKIESIAGSKIDNG